MKWFGTSLILVLTLARCSDNTGEQFQSTKTQKATTEEQFINKLRFSLKDSVLHMSADMKLEHRVFGYERADTSSSKKFLISLYTSDVEGNPQNCQYGAAYDLSSFPYKLKVINTGPAFSLVSIVDGFEKIDSAYLESQWIEFP